MEKFNKIVRMKMGLHARPVNILTKKAAEFSSLIRISKGEKEVDGKRLLAIMTLNAKQGDLVTITIEGEDEKQAASAIKELFDDNFGE